MNRFILQQTIRAIVEELRPENPLPTDLSQTQEQWMESWVVWTVGKTEELARINHESNPTELAELAITALKEELTEELAAPSSPV